METNKSRCNRTWKKKVHWETTYGRIEVIVQRFWDGKKLEVPFSKSADIHSRDYSLLLERVITDFGADVSFNEVVEKLKEHYGIIISTSAVQIITKKHAKGCHDMLEQEEEMPNKESKCVIGEMDGSMIPIVFLEKNENDDKRKWRKICWKEARLTVAKEKGSITKIFLATLGTTECAGNLLKKCVQKIGYGEKTKIHCLGDGAAWIYEQVERVFGVQANYLIDFFHLSDYLAAAANSFTDEDPKKCCKYIENRKGQFNYLDAINNEFPIGSGEIESGNRSVVQKRLKIPGAWWKMDTAENMLALRCVRINGDWKKYWKKVSELFASAA